MLNDWCAKACEKSKACFEKCGSVSLLLSRVSVGWELCQHNTMINLFEQWKELGGDLTLTNVMDAIYMYGGHTLAGDPYNDRMQTFLNTVSYGNLRPTWYVRKMSLLEMMGIINDEGLQIQHIKRGLPDYKELGENYRVILSVNNKEETLQQGKSGGPTLRLEFINTLYEEGVIPVDGITKAKRE